jgi:hypothetical protein
MTNTWALCALSVQQALTATLLAIRFKISTAQSEIVAGTAIASAVVQRLIANCFLLPRLLHQASASKNHHGSAVARRFSNGILFTTNSLKSSQRSALRPGKRFHHV